MTTDKMRSSEEFLRNRYESTGFWNIPKIFLQDIDLNGLELISYSDIKPHDKLNCHRAVHFFVDDYRFESVYRQPEKYLEKLRQYRFAITPDFSLYSDMPRWLQLKSVGKNRWCGAYWQSKGLRVVPSVSWADSFSFDFCFDGLPKNGIVAVGMNGCKHSRFAFMKGYNAMLNHLTPKSVICLGKPFPEMKGNIVAVRFADARKAVR